MRIQQPFRQAHSSPATSPYTREAKIRRLPRESTYNKERPLRRERPKYNFLFLILPGDAPEGVTLSRKSFSAKNLSARSALFHRADRIGRELTRPPHYNKRRYAQMGARSAGRPCSRKKFQKGRPLTGRRTRGRYTFAKIFFCEKSFREERALSSHRPHRPRTYAPSPLQQAQVCVYALRAQMGARSAGRPCSRKKFMEKDSAYRATHQRALPAAEVAVMQ